MWTTRKSLIDRVMSGDEESWGTFYSNYARLIYAIGKRSGLYPEECDDLVQDVMRSVFAKRETFRYDSKIGKFRTYLTGIVRHKVCDILHTRGLMASLEDETQGLELVDSSNSIMETCNCEWKNFVLNRVLVELSQVVDATTFDAFQMYVLQELDPKVIATALSISQSAVYVYKNRCVQHLKKIIEKYKISDPEFNF